METLSALDFYRGMCIILLVVVIFSLMFMAKHKQHRTQSEIDAKVFEDMYHHYKNESNMWNEMYDYQKKRADSLEMQSQHLNDEVARLHGRKDPNSYYHGDN